MVSKDLTAKVREVWLDYCQANPDLINSIKETGICKQCADGNYRPVGSFIMGVLCGLSTEIAFLMPVFIRMTKDLDHIAKSLGLDFDPEIELEKRAEELAKVQEIEVVPLLSESNINPDTDYLNQFRN